ncbi:MAG: NAD-dependent epimerase/dehydratase family protein, partial [Negativicutes bacterium]|nr:NAD-dependent epimerase/dehydratase family protein [Negativicutes bacterium]
MDALKTIVRDLSQGKILITGGTGLVGRQVLDILQPDCTGVRVVSLDEIKLPYDVEYCRGDLTDFAFCREVTAGVDYLFHLAGVKAAVSVSKSMTASHFVPTIMLNTNLLEAARINGVKKFCLLYTS